MKVELEIVEIDGYHSILVNGRVACKDSCEDLTDDLITIFETLGKIERLNMSKRVFNDDEYEEYQAYLDSHT